MRAYMVLPKHDERGPFFSKNEFAYDVERDLYICPKASRRSRATRQASGAPLAWPSSVPPVDVCMGPGGGGSPVSRMRQTLPDLDSKELDAHDSVMWIPG
jgi:hypothetical protein